MKTCVLLRAFLPALASLAVPSALAVNYNYLGVGGTFAAPATGNFSTGFLSPALPGGGPTFGDLLTFNGSTAGSYTATNDFVAPINLNAIRFGNANPVSATVAGAGGSLINFGGTSPFLNFNAAGLATVSANTAFTTSGFIVKSLSLPTPANNPVISGGIDFGAGTSTVIAVADSSGDGFAELTFSGALTGAGAVTLQNNATGLPAGVITRANQEDWGTILFSGDNSGLSGAVNIVHGRAVINNANALGTGTVTVGGGVGVTGGTLSLGGNNAGGTQAYGAITGPGITINNALNLGGATAGNYAVGLQNNGGANTFANTVTLTQTAVNIAVNNRSSLTFGGAVTEATAGTAVTKSGNGTLNFNGTTNFTGGLNINGGNVELAAGATTGTIAIGNGGALNLAGKFPTIASALGGDVTATSTGTLALTTDSSEAVDFTVYEGLSLGAAGNVTYTGTMTPVIDPASSELPVYHLGGGGGTLNIPGTNALTGDNAVVIGSTGATGTVALAGDNDYAGGTILRGGAALVSKETSLGSGDVTFAGGTLAVTGTSAVSFTKTLNFTGAGTIDQSNLAGAQLEGTISGTGTFTKAGAGDLTLLNNSASVATVLVKTGALIAQDEVMTASNYSSVGHTAGDSGRLDLRGATSFTVTGDLNVGDVDANGVVNIGDDAFLQVNTLYVAKSFHSTGIINQTGGTVTRGGGGGEWRIGGFGSAADAPAVGIYNLSGGDLTPNTANFQVGAYGSGMLRQTGGTVTTQSWTDAGRYAGGYGVIDVSGGAFTQATVGNRIFAGESGYGIVTARGSGTITAMGGVTIGLGGTTAGGVVNVNAGGKLATRYISTSGTNGLGSVVNLNGGTLASTEASADFITGTLTVNVFENGAKIDTTSGDVTINQPLVAPEGNGLTSIAFTGGSGYQTAPIVRITGGGGIGATAVAEVDGAGNLTGFTITSHGTGYTSAPTITLIAANGGTATGLTGNLAANVSGALTKIGAGTLTLGGANTYTGGTFVEAGKLVVATGGLLGTGTVVVDGGILDFDYDFTLTTGGLVLNGGELTLDQSLTFAGLTINGVALAEGVYSYAELKAAYDEFFSDDGSGQITVLAVPEPGLVTLLALGGTSLLLARRRRS